MIMLLVPEVQEAEAVLAVMVLPLVLAVLVEEAAAVEPAAQSTVIQAGIVNMLAVMLELAVFLLVAMVKKILNRIELQVPAVPVAQLELVEWLQL